MFRLFFFWFRMVFIVFFIGVIIGELKFGIIFGMCSDCLIFWWGCEDIFEVMILEGEIMVLKLYRLGCIFFWVVKLKWDYLKYCNSYSWLYFLRLVVLKEYVFMKVRFIFVLFWLIFFFIFLCLVFDRYKFFFVGKIYKYDVGVFFFFVCVFFYIVILSFLCWSM